MDKTFTKLLYIPLLGLFMFSLMTGCVDNSYDASEDIDMTMSVGDGVSLPIGSTEKITMDEMMKLNEDDVLKVGDDGQYYIYKKDDISSTTYSIDPIHLNYQTADNSNNRTYQFVSESLGDMPDYMPDDQKFPFRIYTEIEDTILFKTDNDDTAPKEVLDIYTLSQTEGGDIASISVAISIAVEGNAEDIRAFYFGDSNTPLDLIMPDYIVFNDNIKNKYNVTFEDTDPNDGEQSLLFKNLPLHKQGKKNGKYLFQNTVELPINSFEFAKGKLSWTENDKPHPLNINDNIIIKGIIYCNEVQLTRAEVIQLKGTTSQEIDPIKIEITNFTGRVDPQIDPIDQTLEMDLGDDLDFLKDDDVSLILSNPTICIKVNNPTDIPLEANVVLTGQRIDKFGKLENIGGSQVSFDIVLKDNKENKYIISRKDTTKAGYINQTVSTISDLLKTIPDKIKLEIMPKTLWDENNPHHVICKDYQIGGNEDEYCVEVDLEFDQFNLTYTETSDDILGDDPTETTDYLQNVDEVKISLTADNTSPIVMDINIKAYNEQGIPLNNIKVTVDKAIAAGTGYRNTPVSTDVTITLTCENNELVDLNKIDFIMAGSGSGKLNKNDYIQLKNIKATIVEPLIIDMNDK